MDDQSLHSRYSLLSRLTADLHSSPGDRVSPRSNVTRALERAWFTITVNSSAAVESTMNGVSCFLCAWFDGDWSDYGKQLAKYSAGHLLRSPLEIRRIPERLNQIKIRDAAQRALHSPISPASLDTILFGLASPQSETVRRKPI